MNILFCLTVISFLFEGHVSSLDVTVPDHPRLNECNLLNSVSIKYTACFFLTMYSHHVDFWCALLNFDTLFSFMGLYIVYVCGGHWPKCDALKNLNRILYASSCYIAPSYNGTPLCFLKLRKCIYVYS